MGGEQFGRNRLDYDADMGCFSCGGGGGGGGGVKVEHHHDRGRGRGGNYSKLGHTKTQGASQEGCEIWM